MTDSSAKKQNKKTGGPYHNYFFKKIKRKASTNYQPNLPQNSELLDHFKVVNFL